jgi:hypothetical protein
VIANAFGLPSGTQYSCPGATEFCSRICYAGKLEKIYSGVRDVLVRNFDALQGKSVAELVELLGAMVSDFDAECERRGADKLFRIHWDGDFFSPEYAAAWARVIKAFPQIRFWAYTRVATAALFLHAQRLPNLALYFSADRDNLEASRVLAAKGIRIAYVGETFAEGKTALPSAVRCPENNRAMPLISAEGSACARCGLCVHGRRDVLFSASKR